MSKTRPARLLQARSGHVAFVYPMRHHNWEGHPRVHSSPRHIGDDREFHAADGLYGGKLRFVDWCGNKRQGGEGAATSPSSLDWR